MVRSPVGDFDITSTFAGKVTSKRPHGLMQRDTFGVANVFEKGAIVNGTRDGVAMLYSFGGQRGEVLGWSLALAEDTAVVTEHRYSLAVLILVTLGPDFSGVVRGQRLSRLRPA